MVGRTVVGSLGVVEELGVVDVEVSGLVLLLLLLGVLLHIDHLV